MDHTLDCSFLNSNDVGRIHLTLLFLILDCYILWAFLFYHNLEIMFVNFLILTDPTQVLIESEGTSILFWV